MSHAFINMECVNKINFFLYETSEYAKYHDMDENVAVIVCGRNTRFLRYFSHRYEDIRHCLGKFYIHMCYNGSINAIY